MRDGSWRSEALYKFYFRIKFRHLSIISFSSHKSFFIIVFVCDFFAYDDRDTVEMYLPARPDLMCQNEKES